jgi:hypothetical protein
VTLPSLKLAIQRLPYEPDHASGDPARGRATVLSAPVSGLTRVTASFVVPAIWETQSEPPP